MTPEFNELAHVGILGMRWGIRNASSISGSQLQTKTKGITVRSDGSMDIEKGINIQRLVRSNGASTPLKDLTYASITDYDNAKYIKYIGGKGFFGGGRDKIITLTTISKIKAPSIDDASTIVSGLFLSDSKFRKSATNLLGAEISDKELGEIQKDPKGKTAKAWYTSVNTALTFDSDFDPGVPYVKKTVSNALQKKGYNAVRDENDFQANVAKAPIIIFSPETSLKATKISDITDALRKCSAEKLNAYKTLGKEWVDSNLYG